MQVLQRQQRQQQAAAEAAAAVAARETQLLTTAVLQKDKELQALQQRQAMTQRTHETMENIIVFDRLPVVKEDKVRWRWRWLARSTATGSAPCCGVGRPCFAPRRRLTDTLPRHLFCFWGVPYSS